jgi:hypothetical protein
MGHGKQHFKITFANTNPPARSFEGLEIFDEIGVNTGAALLKCNMRTLDQVAALGGHGHNAKPDLMKKVDKEKVRLGWREAKQQQIFEN